MRAFLYCLICLFILSATGRAEVAKVVYTKDSSDSTKIKTFERLGEYYVSLIDLTHIFDASLWWTPLTKKAVFKLGKQKIKVTVSNPIVIAEGISFNMQRVPIIEKGRLYVPLISFIPILNRLTPSTLKWEPQRSTLWVRPIKTNISPPKIEVRKNGTLITIPTEERFNIQETVSEPNWLHLSIYKGKLNPSSWDTVKTIGVVENLSVYQYKKSAQISLHLKKEVNYKIYQTENPNRIVILLRESNPEAKNERLPLKIDRKLWAFDTIIIDPGHGGKDPGAIGPTGLKEKDVVLDIGLRLRELLKKRLHLKVVMTRQTDRFVPLKERARTANREDGDLFLSLHTNANSKRTTNGTETYFLSEAKTKAAENVARRENASIKFEEPAGSISESENFLLKDIKRILADMASNRFLKESQQLAFLTSSKISRRTGVKNRGVNQAGFYVMLGTQATMPSVLIEIAFISNPYEEKLLKTRSFRAKVANSIYLAVKSFIEKQERGMEKVAASNAKS